jgi:phosphoribosylformylglycinamidine synthase
MVGEEQRGERYIGNNVPRVDVTQNKSAYHAVATAMREGVVASAQSVHRGGLAVALAKTAMGGKLGLEASLDALPCTTLRDDTALFSESQGRIVLTVAPQYSERFEKIMEGLPHALIGTILADDKVVIDGLGGSTVVNTNVGSLLTSYKSTFGEY